MTRKFLLCTLPLVTLFLTVAHAAPALEKRGQFSGDGTFYTPGIGACGGNSNSNSMIAAINKPQWGNPANPNTNPICGKTAVVTGPKGSCTVTIVDLCPECAYGSLDLSPAAFNQIADPSAGRVPISWSFAGEAPPPPPAPTTVAPIVAKTTSTPTPTPTPTVTTTSTSSTRTSTTTTAILPTYSGNKVPSVSFPFFGGDVPFNRGITLVNGQNPLADTAKFLQGDTSYSSQL